MGEDFSKLERRIVIEYTIETLSDLHIGARETTDPTSVDNPVMKDPYGRPIVPGSSLKGVLRSEVEKLLSAIFTGNTDKCLNLTVRLFGGEEVGSGERKSYASSVRIRDAVANTTKTRIRDGVRIDRKTRKAADGGKYDLEVVPKGTLFKGTMTIENPRLGDFQYAKLGAILDTIRFFNATNRSLGGATSRGYGEVIIRVNSIREFTKDHYIEGNAEGTLHDLTREEEFLKDWEQYLRTS